MKYRFQKKHSKLGFKTKTLKHLCQFFLKQNFSIWCKDIDCTLKNFKIKVLILLTARKNARESGPSIFRGILRNFLVSGRRTVVFDEKDLYFILNIEILSSFCN